MKNYANILILLAVFIGLPKKAYASIELLSSVSKKDTAKCIVLYFEESQNLLDEYYATNKQALCALDSLLQKTSDAGELEWQIKSYTSPDGDATSNIHTSALRGESVKELLQKRCLNIDISKMRLFSEGEDWAGFRAMIEADPDLPDREDVLALIDYHKDDIVRRKELIKKLDRRVPYKYIVQKVYPRLRRSEIMISWKNREKVVSAVEEAESVIPDLHQNSDSEQVASRESIISAPITIPKDENKEENGSKTILAIKNNLVYDLALAPNIEVEIPIGEKWSLNTEYKYPWWTNSRDNFCYQLLSGGVEARFWLGNRQKRNRLTGHFLGVYAEGGVYDFQFNDDKGYQGKYYGASGLTYGYGLQLARHFSMEFSMGVGYLTTEYQKYVSYEGDIVKSTCGRYNFIGPTKLKVSLVWLITRRR